MGQRSSVKGVIDWVGCVKMGEKFYAFTGSNFYLINTEIVGGID